MTVCAKAEFPVFFRLLFAGCLLLPISTAPEQGGVVSFGLPFLVLASFFGALLSLKMAKHVAPESPMLSFAFLLMIVVSTFFAPSFIQSAARMVIHVIGFLCFAGVYAALEGAGISKSYVARNCLMSCGCLALYFILNFVVAAHVHGLQTVVVERYVGGAMSLPWGASNTIAQVLLLGFGFFAVIPAAEREKRDFGAILLAVVAISLTFSRSVGFLMLLVCIVVFGFRFVATASILGAGAVALTVVALGFDLSGFDVFVSDRLDMQAMATGNSRLDTMLQKLDYVAEHPLEPIGYYGSLNFFELTAHNYWVTTLIEQSFIAVAISLLLFGLAIMRAFMQSRAAGMVFIIIMVGLMVEDPHFTQPYIVLFWILLAVLTAVREPGRVAQAMELQHGE